MEWLETSSELQVPSLEALLSQSFTKDLHFHIVEEVYDHWLEKRLVSKQKLLYRVKKESKRKRSKLLKADDPYVAFRECIQKMHTRKNRAADHENYIKMLRSKKEMQQYMKAAMSLKQKETKKHEALKTKLAMFEDQYRKRNFDEPLMTTPVKFIDDEDVLDYVESEESESEEEVCEEVPIEVDAKTDFSFKPRPGCHYLAVRNFEKLSPATANVFTFPSLSTTTQVSVGATRARKSLKNSTELQRDFVESGLDVVGESYSTVVRNCTRHHRDQNTKKSTSLRLWSAKDYANVKAQDSYYTIPPIFR